MEVDDMEDGRAGSGGAPSACSSDAEGDADCEAAPHAVLFDIIMHECRHNAPGQSFTRQVRQELESLREDARRALVSRRGRGGRAPLFEAAQRGQLALLQYLSAVCGAPLEQRGTYRAPHERTAHRATPLWAAAVAGHLPCVRALHALGADIDAPSDSGSTPLRSACFMSHVEVARYLVEHGADVARANHHGGTCLVNSVQCATLCRLLLAAGAPLDAQDAQRKTALHYAIQEHREDTARLLLAAGADASLRTRQGDDALQLAAIKGAARLVATLCEGAPAARAADAYELLGATQLDEYNDAGAALASWRRATALRHLGGAVVPKRPVRAPAPALGAREWTTPEELHARAHDPEWMRAQALLVAVRVLGPMHRDTLFRLMYRGAAYADAGRYARCVALWTWVLELRIQRDTLLHQETSQTLVALTRLLLDACGREGERDGGAGGEERPPSRRLSPSRAALTVLRMLIAALPESARLVRVAPQCRVQARVWDRALRCAVHLALAAACPPGGGGGGARAAVRALVALDPRAEATGDSLLHLACSRLNVVRSTYFADERAPPTQESVFPHVGVARLLLECGACVQRRNHARSTPLHVAAIPYNFSSEMVELLVSWGAHLDQPNRFGDRPSELVQLNPRSRVRPLRHVTLACLAARALLQAPPPAPRLPPCLEPFLALHRA